MDFDEAIYDGVKDFIVVTVVKQAMVALIARLPWLGAWTPLVWIATKILTKLVSFLLLETSLGINLLLIQLQVDGQVSAVRHILEKFKTAKTEEEKDALEKELIEVSRDLIRLRDNLRLPIEPA